ncbi:MAG: carbamoyl transferase [Acidobacteriota bacterium]|nr:carbamoyl transferase [Acidobacteriota bacterium]MDH3783720.1 carbamoyl transferase [Acidobacteriota bacterium]
MYVLGICGGIRAGHHDGAAALFRDGQLVAAAEEERFLRVKHATARLPENAVRFCLKEAGIEISDIDVVAYNYATITNMRERLADFFLRRFGHAPEIRLVSHYLAHAASAYRLSEFDQALIISADVSGDSVSTFVSFGRGGVIEPLKSIERPNSLGLFYSMITQHLGFARDNDEYKVMGLASYGREEIDLSFLLSWEGGDHRFNYLQYMKSVGPQSPFPGKQEALFHEALIERLGPSRLPDEPLTQRHKDLAFSVQKTLERCMLDLLDHYHRITGAKNVCVAGGVGLNCVMNQRIAALPWVENIFVQPAASDAGGCIGAGCEVLAQKGISPEPLEHVYLGPSFTDDEIDGFTRSYGLQARKVDDPAAYAAQSLSEGKILAWFQGRMEFGPRALGNRSILANPQDPDMKEKINATIKFREDFRPFAPAVLEERVQDCFVDSFPSPFMTMTFDVHEAWKQRLASITHIDGTARIQTVGRKTNPLFHNLISKFDELTGIPVVINTSFNIKGQPICLSPRDAITTFYGTGMDALVVGNWVFEK